MFTALYNIVESRPLDRLKEDGFKDVFKPIGDDELKVRFAPVLKQGRKTGMKDLKAGDVFKIRPSSRAEWSGHNVFAASKIFVTTDWIGEPMPTVVYKNSINSTNYLGAIWRRYKGTTTRKNVKGYWYPAFSRFWALKHLDKIL